MSLPPFPAVITPGPPDPATDPQVTILLGAATLRNGGVADLQWTGTLPDGTPIVITANGQWRALAASGSPLPPGLVSPRPVPDS